jgi:hypothetical protein
MARTAGVLPEGVRITDHISLGVIARAFPREKVEAALSECGKASQRQRDLPAPVVVYYVIALALYMNVSYREVLRCLLEGVKWMMGPDARVNVAGKSGISQARQRLGSDVMENLHDGIVGPIAVRSKARTTRGAWYRKWRVVSIDGSTLDIADEKDNAKTYGRPGGQGGEGSYPQIRFVSLVENGTHVLFGSRMGDYHTGETVLAKETLGFLAKEMLCLADRGFFSYKLWRLAQDTKAALLWRMKKNTKLPCERRFRDGSFLSRIYDSQDTKRTGESVVVRVIEYTLDGVPDAEPLYRLITTILDPAEAPAKELAALYQERWEIESAFDEFKTHLRGNKIVLRSKRPDLVRQEFYGFMMAHYAIRGIMHEAALKADEDPDKLSYVHAVRVIRRKMAAAAAISPQRTRGIS